MVELQGVCKVSLDCALDVHVVAGSTTFALMRTLGISFLFFFFKDYSFADGGFSIFFSALA